MHGVHALSGIDVEMSLAFQIGRPYSHGYIYRRLLPTQICEYDDSYGQDVNGTPILSKTLLSWLQFTDVSP